MKLVKLAEFLAMPPGTVYCKYHNSGSFGELGIKLETIVDSPVFFYHSLTNEFECNDGVDLNAQIHAAENGEPIELEMCFNAYAREGVSDENQLFAVWNKLDVHNLAIALMRTLNR